MQKRSCAIQHAPRIPQALESVAENDRCSLRVEGEPRNSAALLAKSPREITGGGADLENALSPAADELEYFRIAWIEPDQIVQQRYCILKEPGMVDGRS